MHLLISTNDVVDVSEYPCATGSEKLEQFTTNKQFYRQNGADTLLIPINAVVEASEKVTDYPCRCRHPSAWIPQVSTL